MWPSAIKRSFGGFCGACFIIGRFVAPLCWKPSAALCAYADLERLRSGLGSLETAANPFITVCGPPKYAELRINFSQAFNAIGTIIGPVLGSYAFFKTTQDDLQSLKNVQWVYLAIAIFVFCLAGVFYITPLPEVTGTSLLLSIKDFANST